MCEDSGITKEWVFSTPEDDNDEFLRRLKIWNNSRLLEFVRLGLWEGVDVDGNPIPNAKVFSIAEFGPNATLANLAVKLEIFPSITQARKNGWNGPLVKGVHTFGKKKIRVRLID